MFVNRVVRLCTKPVRMVSTAVPWTQPPRPIPVLMRMSLQNSSIDGSDKFPVQHQLVPDIIDILNVPGSNRWVWPTDNGDRYGIKNTGMLADSVVRKRKKKMKKHKLRKRRKNEKAEKRKFSQGR